MKPSFQVPIREDIRKDFLRQALACSALGSPFTSRVCALLAERLTDESAFGSRILNWPGRSERDALPLRAAGGLNALSRSGLAPALTSAYPPHEVDDETLWAAIAQAIVAHDAFLTGFLDSPPQTNEVARSGTILGGALHLAAMTKMPIDLYEIGSSAGLNLGFDRYAYDLGEGRAWGSDAEGVHIEQIWSGSCPPLDAPLTINARHACDQNPLDPSADETRERLLSYVWPDQTARKARLAAALESITRSGFRVETADAADWVERHFAAPGTKGVVKLLLHTIVWQYLPPDVARRIKLAMEVAGTAATADAPVAWLRAEPDETLGTAAVKLTLWPTGETQLLGRADFHGRFTHWS